MIDDAQLQCSVLQVINGDIDGIAIKKQRHNQIFLRSDKCTCTVLSLTLIELNFPCVASHKFIPTTMNLTYMLTLIKFDFNLL